MTFDIASSNLSRTEIQEIFTILKAGDDRVGYREVWAVHPEYTIAQAHQMLQRMHTLGFIGHDEEATAPLPMPVTEQGASLLSSGLQPRIDRQAAERDLAAVIGKARAWNAKTENVFVVTSIKLFGSMLEEREDYGDVDLEFEMGLRPGWRERIDELVEALPVSAKGSFLTSIAPESVLNNRAMRAFKSSCTRSAKSVSMTPGGTIEDLGAEWREVYVFDLETDREVSVDGVTHPRTKERADTSAAESMGLIPLISPVATSDLASIPEHLSLDTDELGTMVNGLWSGREDDGCRVPIEITARHDRHRASFLVAAEAYPAWEVPGATPADRCQAIIERGISEGLLSGSQIDLTIEKGRIEAELELSGAPAERKRLLLHCDQVAGRRSISLRPLMIHPAQSRYMADPLHEEDLRYLPLIRAMGPVLHSFLDACRIPSGADVKIEVSWDIEWDEPLRFFSLDRLGRKFLKIARATNVSLQDVEELVRKKQESPVPVPSSICQDISVLVEYSHGENDTWEKDTELTATQTFSVGYGTENQVEKMLDLDDQLMALFDDEEENLAGLGAFWSLSLKRSERVGIGPRIQGFENVTKHLTKKGVGILDTQPDSFEPG